MKKVVWLYLSSFGIMFAILSWIQEGGIIPDDIGWSKGVIACITGAVLYNVLPKKME